MTVTTLAQANWDRLGPSLADAIVDTLIMVSTTLSVAGILGLGLGMLLYTTRTGGILQKQTGLNVERVLSGPLGGDQQIGARIAEEKVLAVFFFRDPLTAQPHEPDVSALVRLCDVHDIALATNPASAEALMLWLAGQVQTN